MRQRILTCSTGLRSFELMLDLAEGLVWTDRTSRPMLNLDMVGILGSEVLPGLQGVTIRRIVEATGLSLRHCARIRRGEFVPHPRHWPALRALAQD